MENIVEIDVYFDTTPWYFDGADDNIATISVPMWIVEKWYYDHEKDCQEAQRSFGVPKESYSPESWLLYAYTCEDTDGFYNYCVKNGVWPSAVNIPEDPRMEEDRRKREKVISIIDIFEDFLEKRNVRIPTSDAEMIENDALEGNSALIYGCDYADLEDALMGVVDDIC